MNIHAPITAIGKSASNEFDRMRKLTPLGWAAEILKYVVLILLTVTYILPFFWMITSALKNDSQVYVVPPIWFPSPAYWENFKNAWSSQPFNTYVFNTVVRYAIPATFGTVISSAFVAYGFSRLKWPGRDTLFYLCLATMMVPFQVQMVPLFMIFKRFGWIDSFLPLIVPAFFGSPFYIFMLRQFFMTLPSELSDAARIDGANEFDILFRIVLPLSRPALTVVALFSFIGAWNDYLGPLIYVHDQSKLVLALGVENMRRSMMFNSTISNAYPYLMAVSTIVVLPILIMFFFGQKTFIEGISMTGIKE
ncbi:MAG: carbohydrate ABC transporter permease [Chloroflexi bacterium]|nr:carbohydrate ABC transporter permease [Chloroflexota bacterium]